MSLLLEDSGVKDDQIEAAILDLLKGTQYELLSFERNHMFFGNMIAKIKSEKRVHIFISDRGLISCNDRTVFGPEYHIVGEDDSPKYLLKAIEQFVR